MNRTLIYENYIKNILKHIWLFYPFQKISFLKVTPETRHNVKILNQFGHGATSIVTDNEAGKLNVQQCIE